MVTGVTGTGPAPNDIRAFDVTSGQPSWTRPAIPVQTPEPTDGNVYVTTTEDGAFAALDPKSGEVRWKLAGPLNGGVAAGPGLVFAPGGQAIDPRTGVTLWTIARKSAVPTDSGRLDGQERTRKTTSAGVPKGIAGQQSPTTR